MNSKYCSGSFDVGISVQISALCMSSERMLRTSSVVIRRGFGITHTVEAKLHALSCGIIDACMHEHRAGYQR